MEKYELQKLRDLPIEGVAERLGLRVVRHKALCPFHDDHTPSLSFKVSRNTFRCFVCGASGGTIDLVMRLLNKDFREACRWLGASSNLPLKGEAIPASEASPYRGRWEGASSGAKPFDASRYTRFFERPWLNDEARKFLFEERRLDPRVVSWCRLTSWTDRQGTPWLQIPYYNREGKLVGVQNRNLTTSPAPSKGGELGSSLLGRSGEVPSPLGRSGEVPSPPFGEGQGVRLPRFRFPRGSQCGIYNLPVLNHLKPGDELYITEGCSDCWAMLSAGHKAIAIPSATLLTRQDAEQLSMFHVQCSITYHMFPDRDAPGERLFLQLQKVLPQLVHHQLPPECKDYSEYYLRQRLEHPIAP